MSLVVDTLRASAITAELNDAELGIISGLFEVRDFRAGEAIVNPDIGQPDNLYILAHGEVNVKIRSSEGEAVIHVLKPGDLAGIITFVGGTSADVSAYLYAIGDIKVLSLPRDRFESLNNSDPLIVYKVMRGVVRELHGIARRMNAQSVEMGNYIHHWCH